MNKELLQENFNKCVSGYHVVSDKPINEAIWEDINTQVMKHSGVSVYSEANGSHAPGMDIDCSIGKLSAKSAKYKKDYFSVSSYRLTTVCSAQNCGNKEDIIKEIDRRKNGDYYSCVVRDETKDRIKYDWILVPSSCSVFDASSYDWVPKIGKRGKNKGCQVGWNTNRINGCCMTITFSMSSQLWMHIKNTEELKDFVVASCSVSNKAEYGYIDLFDALKELKLVMRK